MNVTLFCDVISGHPSQLTKVQWFMDGLFLNELNEQCAGSEEENIVSSDDLVSLTGTGLCDVDPRDTMTIEL